MSDKVTIFKDADYRGSKKELAIGRYNVSSLGIGNDQLSSLKVPAGLKATLYEHKNFSGRKMVCIKDTCYVGSSANDEVSSIVVEPSGPPKVILYTDVRYGGWSAELAPGRYARQLAIGNDKLSSVLVPQGYRVKLYEDVDFRGRHVVLISDTPSLVNFNFNDLTSSIVIEEFNVTGNNLLARAEAHIGERYVLGSLAPKNNPNYTGPWDCAEFNSWCVYQEAGILYGCQDDLGNPDTANAQTGYWRDDSNRLGQRIPVEDAAQIPGAVVLKEPEGDAHGGGHVVFSDGKGGTVEAKGPRSGVTRDRIADRVWHTGILIPGIRYSRSR